MPKKQPVYDNESISSLKGAERVRKRPGVIFGSDGIEGCEHAVFEILSNAIDEARGGFGNRVSVTLFKDGSIEVEDFGRGIPVDYNNKEGRYNWELLFCEMYAGGKYDTDGANYEYSLGLNGAGPLRDPVCVPLDESGYLPGWISLSLSTLSGGECRRPAERTGQVQADRLSDPLAARPGGLYRHQYPDRLLPRHPQAAGGGQCRGALPAARSEHIGRRDHRVSV